MKKIIYITGVAGGIFLVLGLIGTFAGFSFINLLAVYGFVLIVICITLIAIDKFNQRQKIRNILRNYKEVKPPAEIQEPEEKARGVEGEKGRGEIPGKQAQGVIPESEFGEEPLDKERDENQSREPEGTRDELQEKIFPGEKPEQPEADNDDGGKKKKSGQKGLEPGKTSLRERKAGLVWGGGNIKGATATRGTRRRFLKR
jgi:hypothetical protein